LTRQSIFLELTLPMDARVEPGHDACKPCRRFTRRRKTPAMLRVTPTIAIDEREIEERFVRASGPGGQNVNKLSTAVQLRFDVRRSPSLPDAVRARLEPLAGRRLTNDGVLVITAQRFRTQERNRQDALDRLIALIRQAAVAPKPRRPTKPTRAARERRLAGKKRRASIKGMRQAKPSLD
jgi:ribosome-associated protein